MGIMKIMTIFIKRYYFSSFIIFFFLIIIQISDCFIGFDDYIFEATQLDNGNILIITYDRFYIVDSNFIRIINQTTYCCHHFCDNEKVIHFSKEVGGYILFIDCCYFYIFSKDGEFLLYQYKECNLNKSSFILYGHEDNNSFFYEIYSVSNNITYFKKYAYNSVSKNIILNKTVSIVNKNIYSNYITCQLIEYLNKDIIACFFQTKCVGVFYINLTFFDI